MSAGKSLVFDTGPIISLTTNNLLWILEPLKERFGGDFLMPLGVRHEIIDRPLETRKFKFEGLQVQRLVDSGVFTIDDSERIKARGRKLMLLANSILSGHNHNINILQVGEVEVIATALEHKSSAIVVDERVTRTLIENPRSLHKLMEKKLHMRLNINEKALREFSDLTKDLLVIRSIELVTIAFEEGLLDKYVVNVPHPKRELLESLLWGLKLNGASISEEEIEEIVRLEQ